MQVELLPDDASRRGGGQPYRVELAENSDMLTLARTLRRQVYLTQLGLPAPAAEDLNPNSVVLLLFCGDVPVATMTLQAQAFAPHAAHSPLDVDHHYDLDTFYIPRHRIVEASGLAVLTGQPGAIQLLYASAIALSRAHGITHWLALVEARGDVSSDVPLVHRVLDAHDLLTRPLPLRPHLTSALCDEDPTASRAFSREELRRLPVPPRIRSFARVLGARAISIPSPHPCYARIVVPMLASVSDVDNRLVSHR